MPFQDKSHIKMQKHKLELPFFRLELLTLQNKFEKEKV